MVHGISEASIKLLFELSSNMFLVQLEWIHNNQRRAQVGIDPSNVKSVFNFLMNFSIVKFCQINKVSQIWVLGRVSLVQPGVMDLIQITFLLLTPVGFN